MLKTAIMTIVLATLAAASPVRGVGKITTDPNAPGAEAPAQQEENADPRLAEKITYEARGSTVSTVLSDLSAMTGIILKAGYSQDDWQVRDRRMNIFAEEVPLAHLMSSIARVMKFKWSIHGESGAQTYRLYMDRQTLLDAETRRLRDEQRMEEQSARQREKMLADFSGLDELSPEEMEKLKEDAPLLYILADTGLGGSLGRFCSQVPAAMEAMATGQEMALEAGSLPPEAQATLLEAMRATLRLGSMVSGHEIPFPEDAADTLKSARIEINAARASAQGTMMGVLLVGDITIRWQDHRMQIGLPDPSGKLANHIGRMFLDAIENGRPLGNVTPETSPEIAQMIADELQQAQPGEPEIQHPDDPELARKVKIDCKSGQITEVEAAIAKASKMTVVSDSFDNVEPVKKLGSGEMELRQALEDFAAGYYYNWDKHAGVIELRDRCWYSKRAAQIPEAWLDDWRDSLRKTGTLDLPRLSQIASLTQEQFNLNVASDPVLSRSALFQLVYLNRDLLRLYARLSDSQRAALFTAQGLDLSLLAGDQWVYAAKLVSGIGQADSPARLRGTKESKEKHFSYTFRLDTGGDASAPQWSFTTPSYAPPAEQKKEPKVG